MREFVRTGFVILFCGVLAGQSPENAPKFEAADVHAAAKVRQEFMRTAPVRNGRYEIRNGTMLDLIRLAWNFDPERILGGPNWLELDRFDVAGKVPPDSTVETQRLMLQSLLKDRFKLVAHEETKAIPTWVLAAGKKPQMKEADGSGESGCKAQTGGAPQEGAGRLVMMNPNGTTTTITLGPGATIHYECRNITMAQFASELRTMIFAQINSDVVDQTGIKGKWNFDLKWSTPLPGPMANAAERISLAEAVEKQLGLKLEQTPVPKAVLVVESVERKPSDNPPGVNEVLPVIAPPTQFEVADVKLAAAANGFPGPFNFSMQPGGRFVAEAMPMRFLLSRAFNINNNDSIVGIPGWVDSVRVSITAKVAGELPPGPVMDPDIVAPLLRSLLEERFGLVSHTEQRPGTAYKLVAAKPKLKKADPSSRIYCRRSQPGPNARPGEQALTCQNTSMAYFADRLQNPGTGISGPVEDATGLEGGWDFTLSFNPLPQMLLNGPGRGGDAGPGDAPIASDPGGGYTIFESIEKQLGLKLEAQKRPVPVIVIDKLNQTPTEN